MQANGTAERSCACGCGGAVASPTARFLTGHHRRKSPIDYIEQDCGFTTPCWVWQRADSALGYGVTWIDKRQVAAHRAYYESLVGPIPAGLQLDHLCRNPPCVNPAHLEPVTHTENLRRGNSTKLTAESIAFIRASDLHYTELAERFGVGPRHIHKIRKEETWRTR